MKHQSIEWLKNNHISTMIGENIEIPRYGMAEIDHHHNWEKIFEISKHGMAEIGHIWSESNN